jgi:hypothetical protein
VPRQVAERSIRRCKWRSPGGWAAGSEREERRQSWGGVRGGDGCQWWIGAVERRFRLGTHVLITRFGAPRATPELAYLTICEFAANAAQIFVFCGEGAGTGWKQVSDISKGMAMSKTRPGERGIVVASGSKFDDPAALSGVLTGVSFVGGLATGLSLADAPFPQPGADVKDVQRFFQGSSGPERINVAGQLCSAASLAVFSRSVAQLAGRSGSRMLKAAAIAGGALASTSLAASAAAAAALTTGSGGDTDPALSLHRFLFAAGGPVHGGGLALLLGALGLAGLRSGALPRPLAIASLAAAGVNALAPLVLAFPRAALVIPAGRFPSFVIMGIAGFRLARGSGGS